MAKKKSSPIKKVESETEFVFHKNDVMSEEEDDVIFVSADFEPRETTPPAKKGKKVPRTMAGFRQIVVEEPHHNTANEDQGVIFQTFTLCGNQCCEYRNYIVDYKSELCPCHRLDTVPELDRVPSSYRRSLDTACMEFAKVLFDHKIIDREFDPNITTSCTYDVVDPLIHTCGLDEYDEINHSSDESESEPIKPKNSSDFEQTLKSLLQNDNDRLRIEATLKSLLHAKEANGSQDFDMPTKDTPVKKDESPEVEIEPFFEEVSSFEIASSKCGKVREKLLTESSLEPVDFVLDLLLRKPIEHNSVVGKAKSCPKSMRNRLYREKFEKYLNTMKPLTNEVEQESVTQANAEAKLVATVAQAELVEAAEETAEMKTGDEGLVKTVKKKAKRRRPLNLKKKPRQVKRTKRKAVHLENSDIPVELKPEVQTEPQIQPSDVSEEKSEEPEKAEESDIQQTPTYESESEVESPRKFSKKRKASKGSSPVKNRRKVSRIVSDPESDNEAVSNRRSQPSRTLKNSINYYEPDDELVIDTDVEDFEKSNKTEIDAISPERSQDEEKENICFPVENSKNEENSAEKIEEPKEIEKTNEIDNIEEPPLKLKEIDTLKVPLKESKEETDNSSKLPRETISPTEDTNIDESARKRSDKHDNLSRDPRLRARRISKDEEQKQRREKIHELEKKEDMTDEKLKIRKRKSIDTELIYKTPLSDVYGEETRNYSAPSRTPMPIASRSRDPVPWREAATRPRERPRENLLPIPRAKEPRLHEPLLPTPRSKERRDDSRSKEPAEEYSEVTPSTSRSVIAQDLFQELHEKRTQLSTAFNNAEYPQVWPEWKEEEWNPVQKEWSYDNYRPPEVANYSYIYPRSNSPIHQPEAYKMAYFQTNNITVNVNDMSQYRQLNIAQSSYKSEFPAQSLFHREEFPRFQSEIDQVEQMIPKCDGPCPESPETMPPEDDERPDVPDEEDEILREEFRREFENGYRRESRREYYRPERHERDDRPYQRRYDDHHRRDKNYRPNKDFTRPPPRNNFNYNHRGKHNPSRSRSPDRWGPSIRRRQY